ncbi:hypothetical protein J4558_02135 [Leptolyngbya sp. 15MV]|nr:hypothetical protein J4558_02135 [Leptolyngbya sp. 15MV]
MPPYRAAAQTRSRRFSFKPPKWSGQIDTTGLISQAPYQKPLMCQSAGEIMRALVVALSLVLSLVLSLALTAPAIAQTATATDGFAPTSVHAREISDLSGQWHYIVDPMRMGFRQGRMRNFSRDLVQREQELLEYEWDSAPLLSVPGDWTSQVAELEWYEGLVWKRRRFAWVEAPGRRQFLHFEAVNYHAHVYLNGEKVGEHKGGFTPFAIEVTGKLNPGDNSLVVGIDSRHDARSVPAVQVDWWNYGGITRPVQLLSVPETYLRHHSIRLGRDGRIHVRAAFDGPAAAGKRVIVRVPELGLRLAATANGDGVASASIAAPRGLARWSPASPRLYDAVFEHGDEMISERVGFRTIEVRGAEILLNGEPVFFRGISLHEEAIGQVASRSVSPAAARALLSEAKALGANFVRLAHYPHNEHMARIADEMGLMVWAEIPVYWDMAFAEAETLDLARRMLAELIERDANRASIMIWSVGNETPETPERLAFMRRLIDDARARDPERLISAALHDDADDSSGADGKVTVDDPIGAYLDVLAMNRYEAWYGYRTPPQIDEVGWVVAYDKPLIFSEFGADALYGARGSGLDRWTEDYQMLLYQRTFAMAERIPNLAGTSPWILKDFRSPRRFHGRYQNYWNRKGLIDPSGNRKLAWQVVHDWYAKQAEAGR